MGAVPAAADDRDVERDMASLPRVKAAPSSMAVVRHWIDRKRGTMSLCSREEDCGARCRESARRGRKRCWLPSACVAIAPLYTAKRRCLLLANSAASDAAKQTSSHPCASPRRDPMMAAGSPRSLQFALFGVSSADTCHILHALRNMPLELRHLNMTGADEQSRTQIRTAHRVFGWYNWLLPEDERCATRVIWKSAKRLESMSIQQLARKLWLSCSGAGDCSSGSSSVVLCTINDVARVVRSTDRLYGLRDHRQVWVECLFNFGHQICIGKKELRQYGDYRVQDMATSECQGYLVRPTLTRVENELVVGSMLQCLRAIDPRSEQAPSALVDRIVDDLPRFTLRWEEAFVNDLFRPVSLLDQVFLP